MNDFEKAILESFLAEEMVENNKILEELSIVERNHTGVGFFTYIKPNEHSKLFSDESFVWTKLGGIVSSRKIEVAIIIYVENGFIDCIEVSTYDEEFPDELSEFSLYKFKDGKKLHRTTR